MQESGDQQIVDSVGVDATGQVFNSITAVEQYRGKEMNPLVNPGAIATVGNVRGSSPDEVWSKILGIHSAFAGRQLEVNQEVYQSEGDTNQRNRAISALMSAYERFPMDPAVAVDLYTRACSINVSARDLGVMGATLAFGGRNPVTGKQVIDAPHVPGLLAIMATAGHLRRQRQVAVPHRPAGQERRRRRPDGGLAGQVRHRHLRAAARRGRQQRPRPARDHRHRPRPRRQSLRAVRLSGRACAGGQPSCCGSSSASPRWRRRRGAQRGGDGWLFNDSHFHLTNYVQQGLTVRQYLDDHGRHGAALDPVRNPAPADLVLRQYRQFRADLLPPHRRAALLLLLHRRGDRAGISLAAAGATARGSIR